MEDLRRWLPILLIQAYVLSLHVWIARRVARAWATTCLIGSSAWMILVPSFVMIHDGMRLPSDAISWMMALSLFWVVVASSIAIRLLLKRDSSQFSSNRRQFLTRALPAVAAAPLAVVGTGLVLARRIDVVQKDLVFPGLPKDLNGLRIAQLTDLHFGAFFGPADVRRAVDMANEWNPHLTVLTGDLITRYGDDLEGCLRILAKLRAESGIYGCHGNHEHYARCEESAVGLAARQGIRILRQANETLRFGEARLNLTGFDYQPLGKNYLRGAESHVVPGAFNLLLQHNPDVLPRAARAGFDLTLAGHTHGGQINVDVAGTPFNIAAIYTPFTRGLYHHNGSALYVSSGLGTVALPVRLGAPPEVSLLRLCAA
jgi:predicted MPP superfamily phosphohydrolase